MSDPTFFESLSGTGYQGAVAGLRAAGFTREGLAGQAAVGPSERAELFAREGTLVVIWSTVSKDGDVTGYHSVVGEEQRLAA